MEVDTTPWTIGQLVNVAPRTWAGINRLGGIGKITRIYQDNQNGLRVDVKYTVNGGYDNDLDPAHLSPYSDLDRGSRRTKPRHSAVDEELNKDDLKPNPLANNNNKFKTINKANGGIGSKPAGGKLIPRANNINQLDRTKKKRNAPVKPTTERKLAVTDDEISVSIPRIVRVDPSEDDISTIAEDSAETQTHKRRLQTTQFQDPLLSLPVPVHRQSTLTQSNTTKRYISKTQDLVAHLAIDPAVNISNDSSIKRNDKKPTALEKLRDCEMQEATDFVEALLHKEKGVDSHMEIDNKNNVSDMLEVRTPVINQTRNAFNSHLFQLLSDNDGMLEEDTILAVVNKKCPDQSFTATQVSDFLQTLVADNKIMQSDGMILSI